MSERLTIRLFNAQQGHKAVQDAWQTVKAWLTAGHRLVLEVKPERRSLDQNAKFHAICSDIARARIEWAGKVRNADEWKVLLVSGHSVATKHGSEMVPGLEGEFVNVRESTARMSKARSSSLIEYALAFAASHDVDLRETQQWIDPETGEIA